MHERRLRVISWLGLIVAVLAQLACGSITSASADPHGPHVIPGSNAFDAFTGTAEPPPSVGASPTTADDADPTIYVPECYRGPDLVGTNQYQCGSSATCGQDDSGTLYTVIAISSSGVRTNSGEACLGGTSLKPSLTPDRLAAAFQRVPLPPSAFKVWPVGGTTLVNLPTIVATQAGELHRTVTLLGRRVQLDITPAHFTWHWGDGLTSTTDDPGTAYSKTLPMSAYVTHTYAHHGRTQLRVDTTWTATYRVGGGAWKPVPGSVTIAGTPVPLRIKTATPHLTGSA